MKVLVLGDPILDIYEQGTISRISPEAPVPVLNSISTSHVLGGSLNLAANLANLGASVSTVLPIGAKDRPLLKKLTSPYPNIQPFFIESSNYTIPRKTRFLVDGFHQLLRFDQEMHCPEDWFNSEFISHQIDLNNIEHIAVSDYCKGAITPQVMEYIRSTGLPFSVDTKRLDISIFEGASIFKPNYIEATALYQQEYPNSLPQVNDILVFLSSVCSKFSFLNIVLTKGPDGAYLINSNTSLHVPSKHASTVFDVTGAGDTFFSALIYSALSDQLLTVDSLAFANDCSSQVIQVPMTTPISKSPRIDKQKKSIVGFTNGCFDLFHAGHLSSLKSARSQCDYLVVAVNSDSSIQQLKGPDRPIVPLHDRINLLRELPFVDQVVTFDALTPIELIHSIRPDILFKGEDYADKHVVGSDFVQSYGGQVRLLPFEYNVSTSSIINTFYSNHAKLN